METWGDGTCGGACVQPESKTSVLNGDDMDLRAEQLLDGGEEVLVLERVPVVLHFVVPAAVAREDDGELGEVDAGRLLQVLGQGLRSAGAEDRIAREADLVEDLADLGEPLGARGARGLLVLPVAP